MFVNTNHVSFLYPDLGIPLISQIVDDAKAEVREKSLEKFVNFICNNTKERDYRKINVHCEQQYDANPDRYFYGKTALGLLKGKVQANLRINPNLIKASSAISQIELQNLLDK